MMQKINHLKNIIDGKSCIRYNKINPNIYFRRNTMKKVIIKDALPLFSQEENDVKQILLDKEDYLARIALLREKMAQDQIDIALITGDREHFSNIEYFCGYDCRFEEGLLAIPAEGTPTILVGNEGMGYSYAIPFEIRRVYYRNFSLQGQPRRAEEKLDAILMEAGVKADSRVGVIGFKYFYPEYCLTDPRYTFDIPHYVLETIRSIAGYENVINYTEALTGLDGGIRLRVHSAKEIAAAEAVGCRCASGMMRMLKNLRPGVTEYELGQNSRIGFAPVCMFSLTNFGAEHVSIGLRSPDDTTKLKLGEVCGTCYGIRGNLTSRNGVAAYNMETVADELKDSIFGFYGKFFEAMCAWYETARVGVNGDALHHAVHDRIGDPQYGVTLNVGHFTGMDEWTNALSYAGSTHTVPDGAYMQVDIIASSADPVRSAICEDCVIIAGEKLRADLKAQYPETWKRIETRRAAMEYLGIHLHEDVLPMSNMNAAMYPFMLNTNLVFALEEA